MTVNFTFVSSDPRVGMPDPVTRPDLFEGLLWRRIAAYAIDVLCIGLVLGVLWVVVIVLTVLSLGLLGPPLHLLLLAVPIAYHTLLLSSRGAATLGMRCFDLELRSWSGERPLLLQALVQTVLFYVTVGATCSLVLLFMLFNRRRRALHDILAGTLVLRARPLAWGVRYG